MSRIESPQTPPIRACILLDGVHQALLQGDFAALSALTTALSAEMAALEAAPPRREVLDAVARRASRNALCLLAAQRGIRSAQRRLGDIRAAGTSLVTYDQKGRRAEMVAGRDLGKKL